MTRRGGPRQPGRGQQRPHGKTANASLIGCAVSVIQKQDQPTGRLTAGTVAEILTNSEFHPRGIKVRLTDGTVGRISNSTGVGGAAAEPMQGGEALPQPRPAPSLSDFISFPVLLATTAAAATTTATADASEEPTSSWACPVCTFSNSGFLIECEMCQSARG
jgi:uncharacterized repeat protein (TIGR03833 family)